MVNLWVGWVFFSFEGVSAPNHHMRGGDDACGNTRTPKCPDWRF